MHILGLHDFAELSEDQSHMFKKSFDSLQYVVEIQVSTRSVEEVFEKWQILNTMRGAPVFKYYLNT